MTAPSLIDAARQLQKALHLEERPEQMFLNLLELQRAAMIPLPPDAVIVSRSLLIEAAQALLCTGMFGDIAVTLHVAASGEGKA